MYIIVHSFMVGLHPRGTGVRHQVSQQNKIPLDPTLQRRFPSPLTPFHLSLLLDQY